MMQIIEFMYYKLIHRPEEAMDIQTEWRFVNGLVHLPQDCNLHACSLLSLSYTTLTPLVT